MIVSEFLLHLIFETLINIYHIQKCLEHLYLLINKQINYQL